MYVNHDGKVESLVLLNKNQLPGNSRKSKEGAKEGCKVDPNRPKPKPVVTATRVKKPFIKRFTSAFMDGSSTNNEVVNYIVHDVVIPAAKSTIADLVEGAIEMVLFGGEGGGRSRHAVRSKGRSYVSYSDMYDNRRGRPNVARRPHNVEPALVRTRHDFSDIILGSRQEGEIVLSEMVELLESYGVVTVSDFYDLVGLTSDYTDQKYGWFDLPNISTVRVRNGWALELPRPKIVE